jgi:DME family drug/metabolite transporter
VHTQNTSRRDFLFVVCASVLWGTVGIANQAIYIYSATNALTLAFGRLAIASPLFMVAAWRTLGRRFFQIKYRDLGVMLLMGGLQALYQLSYSAAIPYAGVTVSTLVALCAAPVLVALFSACMIRERLKLRMLIAFTGALGGTVLLVVARARPGAENVSLFGVLLAFLAAIGYAGFILCGRFVSGRYHSLQVNAVAFSTGALVLLCAGPTTGFILVYPLWGWLLLLYLGSIPTALAYALFQAGLRSLSATVTSIVTLLEPCTAALLAWLFFHEAINPLGLLGAGLLLGSLAVILSGN